MNTFWILAGLVALGAAIALGNIAWRKSREFAKGPIPLPKPILPPEKPLSERLASRDMDLELKRWEVFADRQEVNLLCQKIEEGWRP